MLYKITVQPLEENIIAKKLKCSDVMIIAQRRNIQ